MRNFISLIVLLLALQIHGQHVGINTQDPQTELDLNGMLRLRPFVLNIDNDSIDIPSGHGYVSLEGNYFNYYNATLPDAPSGSVLVIENKVPIFSVLVDGQFNIESGHHKSLLKTSSGWQYMVDEQYFERIKENNVSGYRIKGRNPDSYANIGFEAIDLSYATGTSNSFGASGSHSFAVGEQVKASGDNSVVIGSYSNTACESCISIGRDHNLTVGSNNIGIGRNHNLAGTNNIAIGTNNTTSGFNNLALGYNSGAYANYGASIGLSTTTRGFASLATGSNTNATGDYAATFGLQSLATGSASIATGFQTISKAFSSVSIGRFNDTIANSNNNVWIETDPLFTAGNGSSAVRRNALTLYKNGTLELQNHSTMPQNTNNKFYTLNNEPYFGNKKLIGPIREITENGNTGLRLSSANPINFGDIGNHAVDLSTSSTSLTPVGAMGDYSFSVGHQNAVQGDYSFSSGQNNITDGTYGVSFGSNNETTGDYSLAIGLYNSAEGDNSFAFGTNASSVGDNSFALGYNTKSYGDHSLSLGYFTKAVAFGSLAIGDVNDTIAGSSRTQWVATDPLITAGMGYVNGIVKNSFTFFKNGVIELFNHESTPSNYQNKFYIVNNRPFFNTEPLTGQLQKIIENSNAGWRIFGRNPEYYGFIGQDAIDLSLSTSNSSLRGATGLQSFAAGYHTQATGEKSFAIGNGSIASGLVGFSSGYNTKAESQLGSAFGDQTIARGYASTTIGVFNEPILSNPQTSISETTPLFIVGNGNSNSTRSNAMVVRKNGKIEMGLYSQSAQLSLSGGNWDVNNTDGDLVIGDLSEKLKFSMATSGGGTGVARINSMGNAPNQALILGVNGNDQVHIRNDGYVGLGINPSHPIHHVNGARLSNSGTWVDASDARLKSEIQPLKYGLKEVMLLNPKSYIMDKSGDKQVGFIAQELINVIPEVVDGVEGDIEIGETLGVSYGNIVAVLTKAIQEQQLLINEKDERIKVLEKKYTQLESLVMNIVSTNNHDSFNTNNQSKK